VVPLVEAEHNFNYRQRPTGGRAQAKSVYHRIAPTANRLPPRRSRRHGCRPVDCGRSLPLLTLGHVSGIMIRTSGLSETEVVGEVVDATRRCQIGLSPAGGRTSCGRCRRPCLGLPWR
jgi:hypothetical protein